MRNRRNLGALSLLLLGAVIGAQRSAAQSSVPFYRGKTITIVVGTSAGGGYDSYARLLARHLGKHLPGEPSIVVSNMPGGGSEVAAGYVARVAPKDGTFIAAPNASALLFPILQEAANLNYDPSRVNYLGTALSDNYLCIVRPDAAAKTFGDMFTTPVVMGGSQPNEQTGMMSTLLDNVLGTKFKVVFGYPGFREVMMAFQKGEVQGSCGVGWLTVKYQYADMFKKGEIKLVAQENSKGLPELDAMGLPLTVSYARDEQRRRILEIVYSQETFARPYFVAAEVPADRLQLLRRAIMESWRDPELLADAAAINVDITPVSGEDLQALLQNIYASPPDLIRAIRDAVKPR
jgi:tripartite-type tricarboxylate transporter receptor subunit TctC